MSELSLKRTVRFFYTKGPQLCQLCEKTINRMSLFSVFYIKGSLSEKITVLFRDYLKLDRNYCQFSLKIFVVNVNVM